MHFEHKFEQLFKKIVDKFSCYTASKQFAQKRFQLFLIYVTYPAADQVHCADRPEKHFWFKFHWFTISSDSYLSMANDILVEFTKIFSLPILVTMCRNMQLYTPIFNSIH